MDSYDVISAFIDGEPFEPPDLAAALADPGGRQMLLDLVALRTIVRDEPIAAPPRASAAVSRPKWIAVGFLAASMLFGAGAAVLLPPLLRQRPADVPPTPARVVTFDTAAAGDARR